MKKLKHIKWVGFKELVARPRLIILVSLLVLTSSFVIFIFTIYTKDKPKFIPEETRETVRGSIVENIAQPLQSISNPVGTFIINAAHKETAPITLKQDIKKEDIKTENWPTYIDKESGISVQYPLEWVGVDSGFDMYFFVNSDNLSKFEELKSLSAESGGPYWGSFGIGFVVDPINDKTIADFVGGLLGEQGIQKEEITINGNLSLKVVDKSDDRYGGGVGYYYFIKIDEKIVTVSLDYFGGQEINNEMIENLGRIASTVK